MSRMRDGGLDPAPIWTDVRTLDGRPWRGCVDIISGGFPCQDVSISKVISRGVVGKGVESGARSGLWAEYSRIVGEIRPNVVFVENVAMLTNRGLTRVISDLARYGYNARWGTFSGNETNSNIQRKRIFILASPNSFGLGKVKNEMGYDRENGWERFTVKPCLYPFVFGNRYKPVPDLSSESYEPASVLDEIKCIGNGVVPQQAALAFQILSERIR